MERLEVTVTPLPSILTAPTLHHQVADRTDLATRDSVMTLPSRTVGTGLAPPVVLPLAPTLLGVRGAVQVVVMGQRTIAAAAVMV